MKRSEGSMLGALLKRIAPRIGARVHLDPEWGFVGQIVFKSGRKSYFRYNTLDLNPVGSSDIAKDKDYAAYFMKRMGYPVPEGSAFYSKQWCAAIGSRKNIDAAYRFGKRLGFPLIVKPNSGSQGQDVQLVWSKKDFYGAMRRVFRSDRIALVQKPLKGKDYRIVVLDTEVISAYERIPLHVIGDGRASILQLLKRKQKVFAANKRDTRINADDPRISAKLKQQKLSLASVLARGEMIFLLDNANLSSGGDSSDVTDEIHPAFKKVAVQLTRDMGLRLAGVDLMIDGDIREKPNHYSILEINAAPGLDHYVKSGKAQENIVEKLYLKVLKALDR